mgnify:CR=1 FL=1
MDTHSNICTFDSRVALVTGAAVGFFGCGGNVLGALGPGLLGGLNGLFGMRASLASLAVFALAGALVILLARQNFNHLRKELKP